MSDTYSFRPAVRDDFQMISDWFTMDHVVEHWGEAQTNVGHFVDRMDQVDTLFDYWIGFYGITPFSLFITTDARRDTPGHLLPYIPDAYDVWTLDVLIGDPTYIGKGHGVAMLNAILIHFRHINPNLTRVLIDPAQDNPRAVHVYERVGFVEVSRFTAPDAPFNNQPHVLLGFDYV